MIEILPLSSANQLAQILVKFERHLTAFANTIYGHTVYISM